ncbi:MAG TPA: hypothetical protein VGE38_15955 [Nocardioides sp.]|uniref:hypothetical protein n=1 Tax=Nocardioides sp. TaxID=35761 RepID=UPI002ED7FCF7
MGLRGSYDAALHLLDRQIVDSDDLMVAKVDDVALSPDLEIVGLLCGPAVLLPRLGGRLGPKVKDFWERMAPEQADRSTPCFIPVDAIAEVGSEVRLNRVRQHLLVRHEPPGHRLGDLLGLPVRGGGRSLGRVIDVRVREGRRVDGLVVGRGGPGSLLGYDRRRDQGPWLVGAVVRWRHRHTGYVGRADVLSIDWGHGVEVSVAGLGDLPPTT